METILQRLTELNEVRNAILVGNDGLIVSGLLQNDEEEMIGAMSAAVFGSISEYTTKLNSSEAHYVTIETKQGTFHMQVAGDLVLIVTTQGAVNLGRLRFEMQRASQQLQQLVGNY